MKIAVLGWGSLIWSPQELKILNSKWHTDGPFLPVEFARVSQDGRLTLVLYPGTEPIQVLWNVSACSSLEEAVANLVKREGTLRKYIGYYSIPDNSCRCNAVAKILDDNDIKNWLKTINFDAVVWTDLPSNFFCKTKKTFNADNVVTYLKTLKNEPCKKAKDYIINAPKQVSTPVRRYIEKTLNWRP